MILRVQKRNLIPVPLWDLVDNSKAISLAKVPVCCQDGSKWCQDPTVQPSSHVLPFLIKQKTTIWLSQARYRKPVNLWQNFKTQKIRYCSKQQKREKAAKIRFTQRSNARPLMQVAVYPLRILKIRKSHGFVHGHTSQAEIGGIATIVLSIFMRRRAFVTLVLSHVSFQSLRMENSPQHCWCWEQAFSWCVHEATHSLLGSEIRTFSLIWVVRPTLFSPACRSVLFAMSVLNTRSVLHTHIPMNHFLCSLQNLTRDAQCTQRAEEAWLEARSRRRCWPEPWKRRCAVPDGGRRLSARAGAVASWCCVDWRCCFSPCSTCCVTPQRNSSEREVQLCSSVYLFPDLTLE